MSSRRLSRGRVFQTDVIPVSAVVFVMVMVAAVSAAAADVMAVAM